MDTAYITERHGYVRGYLSHHNCALRSNNLVCVYVVFTYSVARYERVCSQYTIKVILCLTLVHFDVNK